MRSVIKLIDKNEQNEDLSILKTETSVKQDISRL
jgi:hypothetical protein